MKLHANIRQERTCGQGQVASRLVLLLLNQEQVRIGGLRPMTTHLLAMALVLRALFPFD